jgi:hypothetical protein
MRRQACALFAILLGTAFWAGAAWAESGPMRGPHAGSSRRQPLGTPSVPDYLAIVRRPAEAAATAPFTGLLNFYRTAISPVDGNRCEMAPTCSLYAQQAFKEHGVVLGFLLTADRLLHEADEQPRVRTVTLGGAKHYLDPVSANIYWLPRWMR